MPDTFEQILSETMAERAAAAPEPEPEGDEPGGEEAEPEQPETETDPDEGQPDPDEPEDEDGEDEEGDDAEDEPAPVTVQDETVLVLDDGTTLTGKELSDGYLRQADYTRKTQELAEQRREVETQMDDLAASVESNPVGWVENIVSQAQDPTATLAQALVSLAREGKLDPEFVKTFGLESGPVAEQASTSATEDRIARLERERIEEREAAEQAAERDAALNTYRQQYAEIVTSEGLRFDSPEAETKFKAELAGFAGEHKITDLRVAYDAMSRRQQRQQASAPPAVSEASEQVRRRKQASSAITAKGGTAPRQKAPPATFEDAATEAIQALTRKGRM